MRSFDRNDDFYKNCFSVVGKLRITHRNFLEGILQCSSGFKQSQQRFRSNTSETREDVYGSKEHQVSDNMSCGQIS